MRHQYRVLRLQFGRDRRAMLGALLLAQHTGLLGGQVGLDQESFGNVRHSRYT